MSRRWTKEEELSLYEYSVTMGQHEAAEILGRSFDSVTHKANALGIRWRQGCWNLSKIATEVGCSKNTVKRLIKILYPDRRMFYVSRGHRRYIIEDKDAERIIRVLRGTRSHRAGRIRGGIARHGNKGA